ncbi:MAG: F0F1 ATP synthase subunit delta, partial [Pseudomonadota bacterium]
MAAADPKTATMPGRYASALFELAKGQDQVDAIEKDLGTFQSLLDESDDLRRLVRSPVFSADDQIKALDAVLEKAGVGGLTANFMRVITQNRRLFAATDIISAFRAMASEDRGE